MDECVGFLEKLGWVSSVFPEFLGLENADDFYVMVIVTFLLLFLRWHEVIKIYFMYSNKS